MAHQEEGEKWGMEVNTGWVDIQKRTFTRWANNFLQERMLKIEDLGTDLHDGIMLINLLEQISGKSLGNYNKKAKIRAQKLENTGQCLRFLRDEGIKLVAIGPEDLVDCHLKLILGLIWTIILRYQIQKIQVSGSSPKNDLLQWVRKQIPQYDIKNFKEDWRNGKALCALVDALEPGSIDLSNLNNVSPLDNARNGTDTAEKALNIPAILSAEDLVSPDIDELSVMTYISYFRDYEQEKAKNADELVRRRVVDPLRCIAFGPGLEGAEVGYEAEFTIQARNSKLENVDVGGENFDVKIVAPANSPPIKAQVTDKGDGTYKVTYTPKAHGKHTIGVRLMNKDIANSPFTVNAERGGPDPSQCEAYGPGLEGGAPGDTGRFTIQAKNRRGDPIPNGGDRFDVSIVGPYNNPIPANLVDNKDGTYDVSYKPTDVGDHTVIITAGPEKQPIKNSPVHVNIEKDPINGADASQSNAYGPGLEEATSNEPTAFTIQARNKHGDPLKHGGDPFDVEVLGPDGTLIPTKVIDNKDGTYAVSYTPTEPGDYKIDVVLKTPQPLYYDHISQSPFLAHVEAAADAGKSIVFGPAIEDGVSNTIPSEFKIQARDKDGKNMDKGGDPFEVKVTDPNGNTETLPITDNGDGTYTVPFSPDDAGRHKVDVRLKGKPVGNTPLTLNVKDGADHQNSSIECFSFVVRTRTKQGKDKREGGEKVEVAVSKRDGERGAGAQSKVTDNKDGSYTCTYSVPPASGEYSVAVTINGKDIQGSPFVHIA